jgi:hypothetical protein
MQKDDLVLMRHMLVEHGITADHAVLCDWFRTEAGVCPCSEISEEPAAWTGTYDQ